MGFEVVVDAHDVYKELVVGDARLGLYRRELMAERLGTTNHTGDPMTRDHVCLTFAVDDVDRAIDELREKGAEIATAPHDEEAWVLRVAHVRDPEGNLLEINAPLAR
jgi:lactoylglutathione lyase